jgi:catechol 2,3-dioxygenase
MNPNLLKPAVAQLAHVELFTPKPDESLWFFKELLGMEEVDRQGQSVYLRAYEDFYHHTLKLTESNQAGLGHVGWRTSSAEVLQTCAQDIESTGLGRGWSEGDLGHGPAYQFISPDGHNMEILWEVEYYQAPPEKRSLLRSRPQKRPLRGIPVRRIDHINLLTSDVVADENFAMGKLGFNLRETKIGKEKIKVGSWLSVSALSHEFALTLDATRSKGRLHHVAFWYGYPQNLFDFCDACPDYGIKIEVAPGKHGASQAYFLYVFEPGGNRIELYGDTGYQILDPNWKTIVWDVANEEDFKSSSVWFGPDYPDTFYHYGTPDISKSK